MTRASRRRATYEDLLAVPETRVAEILDGELITSPRPGVPHALAHSALIGLLHPPFHRGAAGPGGWWILTEPQLHLGTLNPDDSPAAARRASDGARPQPGLDRHHELGWGSAPHVGSSRVQDSRSGPHSGQEHAAEDIVVPDVAGWRRERMAQVRDGVAFRTPPDWVCEILSPSTERIDRTRKLPIYERAGIAFVWLIDPAARTLEVLRLVNGRLTPMDAFDSRHPVRAQPFDVVELDLASLWD